MWEKAKEGNARSHSHVTCGGYLLSHTSQQGYADSKSHSANSQTGGNNDSSAAPIYIYIHTYIYIYVYYIDIAQKCTRHI